MSADGTTTKKLDLLPGINKNTTELDAEGVYTCCDKVRFFYGKPEKIGGWQKETYFGSARGIARDVHTWVDNDQVKYLGFGTSKQLGVLTGGEVFDITPIEASACANNVMNTTSGSNEIIVSIDPLGAQAGDYFTFETVSASIASIDLTSIYSIASAGVGSFSFLASTSAALTTAGAGGVTKVNFLLRTGNDSNGTAFGWGAGTWSTPGASASAGWSDPRGGAGLDVALRQWSLDNWGQDFIANPRGGKIYLWETSAGTSVRARVVSSAAPSVVNVALVAQEGRHLIAFGTHDASGDFDPNLIRWSDSEDYSQWTAAASNQAGSFRLENGSFIIGAVETRGQMLVFTDESLYSMTRIGGVLVFGFRDLGNYNGLMSQHAAVDVNGIVVWMAYNSFQSWDGTINTLPCTVQEYIFNQDSEGALNLSQKEKVFCATLKERNEIWWFYPSRDSDEIDRYVVFNYMEKLWYIGTLDRTVWHDVDIFERPYAFDTDGQIFIHEQGKNDDTAGLRAVLKSSFFDLDDGGELMFVDRIIPDSTIIKEMNYTFEYKKYPQAVEEFTKGPYTVTPTTQKIQPRIRGRQARVIYSTSVQGGWFRIGSDRVAIKPDGKR